MMGSRWDRIVALRSKLQKQAEAALRAREVERARALEALAQPPPPGDRTAGSWQQAEFLRAVLLRFERHTAEALAHEREELRRKAIATKQAEALMHAHEEEQARMLEKLEQQLLETWQRGRRARRLL